MQKREEVIKLLNRDKSAKMLQEKYKISDLEIDDIQDQIQYRRKRKKDEETQIKQDSKIRIEVLCLKLGLNQEQIRESLQLQDGELEVDTQKAVQYGLIKPKELNGIKPLLEIKAPEDEQMEL